MDLVLDLLLSHRSAHPEGSFGFWLLAWPLCWVGRY